MKLNRSNSSDSEHTLVSLDERDLADLDRLLAKLRGPRPSTIGSTDPGEDSVPGEATLARRARHLLDIRQKRVAIFGRSMFAEPAWEMLLILYLSAAGQRQTQASLRELAGASRSTASRWIDYLHDQGLVGRQEHPTDKRTNFISLSEKGRRLLELYLSETS